MSSLSKAQAAYSPAPDWITALAEECDRTSQGKAAERIGYSKATVNLVINGNYKDLKAVEEAVRVKIMNGGVPCPFLGAEVPLGQCIEKRNKPLVMSSGHAVQQWKACQACEQNPDKE